MEQERDRLFQQIGKLQVELDWLKKDWVSTMSIAEKCACIDPKHATLSIVRQCDLVGLPRSNYYRPSTQQQESAENLQIMALIDEEYTKYPFFGSRKIRDILRRQSYNVNRKRIQRLMRIMGIESIAPKPSLSKPHPEHKIYSYLLRNLPIVCPDQVWSTDITYVPFGGGFVYLTAVIDRSLRLPGIAAMCSPPGRFQPTWRVNSVFQP